MLMRLYMQPYSCMSSVGAARNIASAARASFPQEDKMPHDNFDEERAHVWKLVEKIRTCMFCINEGDMIHGRPMTAYADADEGAIYFLTEHDPAHEEELRADSHVCCCFIEGSK